jgi:hypothetical protein
MDREAGIVADRKPEERGVGAAFEQRVELVRQVCAAIGRTSRSGACRRSAASTSGA